MWARCLPVILAALVLLLIPPDIVVQAQQHIVINEVELNPPGNDSLTSVVEAIEIYNTSNVSVDVGGWTVSSTAGRSATLMISEGTMIPPSGYLVIGSGSQWLDNSGEVIVLRDASGTTIDTAGPFNDDANSANTWQRSPDGSDNWIFAISTLDAPNIGTQTPAQPSGEPTLTEEPEPLPESSMNTSDTSASITQNLKVVFIDVGQGDSTLIILPNGKTVLIDGGERNQSQTVLAVLEDQQVNRIDVMIATHPHADHIGGLIGVINSVEVGQILDSGQIHTTQTFEDFLDAIDSHSIPLVPVREGEAINLDPQVQISILNPRSNLPVGAHNEDDFNNNSVVVRLDYDEFSAIFPGDIELETEQRLANEKQIDVDVLLASHHGSRGSNTASYLEKATPEVVLIYAGENNPYGHPHQESLDRIALTNPQYIFRTDIDGTVILESDGSAEYSLRTANSSQVVVVPEFENAVIIVASMSILSIVILTNRSRIWKSLGQA